MTPVADPAGVAVFDLDGTLTRRDTLPAFLAHCLGRNPRAVWRLWRLPFTLGRFSLGLSDRGRLKAALLRQVLGGASAAAVAEAVEDFCTARLPSLLLAPALAAVERHRLAGDRLVLMSASVDVYVPRIAALLRFDEVLCTGAGWTGGRLDGTLTTENCRGREKARRLQALRTRCPGARVTAYGNAASDLEHLLLADEALLVNASRSARRGAAALGVRCADWRQALAPR